MTAARRLIPSALKGLLRPMFVAIFPGPQRTLPPGVPTGAEKREILRSYARDFQTRVFVETGTFLGDTVAALRKEFDLVYTIELHGELFRRAQGRFVFRRSVHVVHGDSSDELVRLLPKIDRPTLFWLDAHYSRGGVLSARGRIDPPLLFELESILSLRDPRHVVLIDDARLLGVEEGYPDLEQIGTLVDTSGLNLVVECARDVVRIHRTDRPANNAP